MTMLREPELDAVGIQPLIERRCARRHDLETRIVRVERFDGCAWTEFGQLIDLSSNGMRLRTNAAELVLGQQIRLRIQLPSYAGIYPFIDTKGGGAKPSNQWVGWMSITRVVQLEGGRYDIAGRIIGMDELDRGMLALYLSTQPLAA